MAATAAAAIDFKRLAGVPLTGRKLEKPVCHYLLNWAPDETPDRREMSRAIKGSLEALGLEAHQALIVAHNDTPACARDREPRRSGDREGGEPGPRPRAPLEVGGRV